MNQNTKIALVIVAVLVLLAAILWSKGDLNKFLPAAFQKKAAAAAAASGFHGPCPGCMSGAHPHGYHTVRHHRA